MASNLTEKQEFIKLRAQGYSLIKISKELNKTRQTLASWHNELQEEVSNAKAIELEALFEECLLTKEYRVKNLSALLDKISKELDKRVFDEVSTEKLVEIKMKLSEQLKSEYIEPKIKSEDELRKDQANRILLKDL